MYVNAGRGLLSSVMIFNSLPSSFSSSFGTLLDLFAVLFVRRMVACDRYVRPELVNLLHGLQTQMILMHCVKDKRSISLVLQT